MGRRAILIVLGVVGLVGALYLLLPFMGELVSPGPVAQAHAKIEDRCLSCHVPFSRSGQNGRCKDCHEDVGKDVDEGTGYHGRDPQARQGTCASCHSDHKGRGFDMVSFNQAGFDHRLTDFRLEGAHAKLECKSCHKARAKYTAAPVACVGCHEKDDEHQGRFGTRCEGCHNTVKWDQTHEFDHSVTGFNLLGKHRQVSCEGCHAGGRFVNTPTRCVACHKQDDIHQGTKGDKCEDCHVASGWEFTDFRHDRDTRFPLTGLHRKVTCEGCHGPREAIKRPPMTCIGCHAQDDVHKGRFGRDCASCHSTRGWKQVTFDHDKSFPLRGTHAKIACKACHVRPAGVVRLPETCNGCHASDDVHRGRLGRDCKSCHGDVKWSPASGFNHARTDFPLEGRHKAISCTACHADKTFSAKGTTCVACHPDTRHEGRFGRNPACGDCHNSTIWSRWTYNHGRQAGFVLDGKHERLSCYACHSKPAASAKLGSSCVDCHRADDIHEGEFGGNCADCHSTSTWKNASVPKAALGAGRAQPPGRSP